MRDESVTDALAGVDMWRAEGSKARQLILNSAARISARKQGERISDGITNNLPFRRVAAMSSVSSSTEEAARILISSVRVAAGEVPDSLSVPAALSSSEPVPSSSEPPTPDSMPQKSTSSSSR